MVRLKDFMFKDAFRPYFNFNSNMVRLKDDVDIYTEPKVKVFQFQYGSIKSSINLL